HQKLSIEFARFGEPRLQLTGLLNNIDSDSRSLPRRLDDQGNGQRRLFIRINHLPPRSGDTSRFKFSFRFDFIECGPTFFDAVAGPSFTIKFPCTFETRAFPMAQFFKPSSSTNFPAGILSGFLKMHPALDAAGWVVLRLCCDSSSLRTISSFPPGTPRNTAKT